MALDDRDDFCKKRGEPNGTHLRKLTELIYSCGATFSVCAKKKKAMEKGWGKWNGHHLWVMRKRILPTLPTKLTESNDAIHTDSKDTVVKLWMVRKNLL